MQGNIIDFASAHPWWTTLALFFILGNVAYAVIVEKLCAWYDDHYYPEDHDAY